MPPYLVLTRLGKCYNPEHGARLDQLVPPIWLKHFHCQPAMKTCGSLFCLPNSLPLLYIPLSSQLTYFLQLIPSKGSWPKWNQVNQGLVLHTIGRDHRVTSCHVLVSTVVQNEWIYERYQAEILILCVWDESSPLSLLAGGQLQFASLKAPKTFVS